MIDKHEWAMGKAWGRLIKGSDLQEEYRLMGAAKCARCYRYDASVGWFLRIPDLCGGCIIFLNAAVIIGATFNRPFGMGWRQFFGLYLYLLPYKICRIGWRHPRWAGWLSLLFPTRTKDTTS